MGKIWHWLRLTPSFQDHSADGPGRGALASGDAGRANGERTAKKKSTGRSKFLMNLTDVVL
jgi:hypothetical protein